jgi:hypothetical protein
MTYQLFSPKRRSGRWQALQSDASWIDVAIGPSGPRCLIGAAIRAAIRHNSGNEPDLMANCVFTLLE